MNNQQTNQVIQQLCLDPMKKMADFLGKPVTLIGEPYENALEAIRQRNVLALVVNLKKGDLDFIQGVKHTLEQNEVNTLPDFLKLIHPEYLPTYLHFGISAYKTAIDCHYLIRPLEQSYRVSIPLRHCNGNYYWYAQKSTAIQVDDNNYMLAHLNTYEYEGLWNKNDNRPFQACLSRKNRPALDLDSKLVAQLTAFVLDVFTNVEIELLQCYAAGLSVNDIRNIKPWARYTILDYNKQILKKAKKALKVEKKSAAQFAYYCSEKGFIQPSS